MKELIIVGGGFAGLKAALTAAFENKENDGNINITLVSQNDFLVMRPRLYESNPEKMRVPFRPMLDTLGINFVEGLVSKIVPTEHTISIKMTRALEMEISYDQLILAAGSVSKSLPIPGLKEHSWNINSYQAAIALDGHLLKVARLKNIGGQNRFVILGAGITGIEMAMELRSRIHVHSDDATAAAIEILLIDQADHIGPAPSETTAEVFEQAFKEANILVKLGQTITNITLNSILLADGEEIETATVIVTTGLQANPLADLLDVERDASGRLTVDGSLRVNGVKNIFAAGDIAAAKADDAHMALMSCQHAMPMGAHAGYNAVHSLLGLPHQKYAQPDYSTCVDLGEIGTLLTKGWDRQIVMTGPEAKALKQKINGSYIYPPDGNAADILAHSHIDAHWADSNQ